MNSAWAQTVIEALVTQGVTHFCASPGSRNAPLVLAAAQRNLIVHFDERGMAFHALGLAKALQTPVALIVTSGSAVANLYPAVMEAFYDCIPLLVLTADRPPEAYDSGANQTVDQIKFFGSHVRWHHSFPSPDKAIPARYIHTTIAQALAHAKHGPVHLNLPFRPPLIDQSQAAPATPVTHIPTETYAADIESLIDGIEEGLILAGSHIPQPWLPDIQALSDRLKWPLIGDILSGIHAPCPMIAQPRAVIQFGDRFVSRLLLEKLGHPEIYIHVSITPHRHDPYHLVTHRIDGRLRISPQERPATEWYHQWETARTSQKPPEPIWSEPAIMTALPTDATYFLGNSLAIRNANAFFTGNRRVFANRGCSGIDGNIATATGISRALKRPLIAVIGDLTLLHDLNSLALLQTCLSPITIFVINNGGGGIFSLLPTLEEKQATYETCIATPHNYTFKEAAKLFNIPYANPTSLEEVKASLQTDTHALIEVHTTRSAIPDSFAQMPL